MSLQRHSQTDADISNRLRRKIGTRIQKEQGSGGSGNSQQQPAHFGPYGRVVAKVRRAASVLEADDGRSLPQVSVNGLERAVSTFLEEVRLGLPREDSSGQEISSRQARYGRKLTTELKDPALAQRVRDNRAKVREEQAAALHSRKARS